MSGHYALYGLHIRTEFPLDAPQISAGVASDIDVDIRRGRVPERLEGGRLYNPLNWAAPGQLLLNIPSVARYLVSDGRTITVEPAASSNERSLALFTAVSPLAGILHQRGRICLHASAVSTAKGCVVFMGPSGFGKSTLAGALRMRGYQVVTDDMAVLEGSADEGWSVKPGPGRIKLWPDSLEALGLEAASLPRVRHELDKRFLIIDPAVTGSRRLRALCVLGLHGGDGVRVRRISLPHAMEALMFNTFRRRMQAAANAEHENFRRLAQLAAALPCFCVERGTGTLKLAALVDEVEKMVAAL